MVSALSQMGVAIPIVRQAAYSIKAIRGVRVQGVTVRECLIKAEEAGNHETYFRFRREFDIHTGIIHIGELISSERAQDPQLFSISLPTNLDTLAIGHTHPFGDPWGTTAVGPGPSLIDNAHIRDLQMGVSNSATILFGGGQGNGWGIGAWTYDERKVIEPFPEHPKEAEKNVYSLPLEQHYDLTKPSPPLDEDTLHRIRIVHVDNSRPYLAEGEGPEDVSDVIALRKWLIAAEFLQARSRPPGPGFQILEIRDSSGMLIEPEPPKRLLADLRAITEGTSRAEFLWLRRLV